MSIISATTICNEALTFLGESLLLTFPEESRSSDLCEVYYDRIVASELSKHPWNFALAMAALTRAETTPPFEFSFQYVLPVDLLRILRVYPPKYKWRRVGQYLLTNLNTVSIEYITLVDESLFSPTFSEVVSARLAMTLAEIITERENKLTQAANWYQLALQEAHTVDSQEHSVDEMENSSVVDVRTNNLEPFYQTRPVSI